MTMSYKMFCIYAMFMNINILLGKTHSIAQYTIFLDVTTSKTCPISNLYDGLYKIHIL